MSQPSLLGFIKNRMTQCIMITLANHYVEELVSILESVELIDLDLFKRNHFTLQSIHLKYDCKKKLA